MLVFNFKYVVLSFSFKYLLICSDNMISMMTTIECLQRKDVYYPPSG